MHKFFAKTEYLGKSVFFLPHCHSTNDEALKHIKQRSAPEGTTIITSNQSNGRGQRGSIWEAEAGKNVTFSVILRPHFLHLKNQFAIHIITSLAVYDALSGHLSQRLSIKWPNDLYFEDKKLGGILVESRIKGQKIEYAVLGIGINVNQSTFKDKHAVSILNITDQTLETNEIIENILKNIEKKYNSLKNGYNDLLTEEYLEHLYRRGKTHLFKSHTQIFKGKIIGIDAHGQLQIEVSKKVRTFNVKEVTYL